MRPGRAPVDVVLSKPGGGEAMVDFAATGTFAAGFFFWVRPDGGPPRAGRAPVAAVFEGGTGGGLAAFTLAFAFGLPALIAAMRPPRAAVGPPPRAGGARGEAPRGARAPRPGAALGAPRGLGAARAPPLGLGAARAPPLGLGAPLGPPLGPPRGPPRGPPLAPRGFESPGGGRGGGIRGSLFGGRSLKRGVVCMIRILSFFRACVDVLTVYP